MSLQDCVHLASSRAEQIITFDHLKTHKLCAKVFLDCSRSYHIPVPHHLSHQSVTAEAWMRPLIATREAPSIMVGFLPTQSASHPPPRAPINPPTENKDKIRPCMVRGEQDILLATSTNNCMIIYQYLRNIIVRHKCMRAQKLKKTIFSKPIMTDHTTK